MRVHTGVEVTAHPQHSPGIRAGAEGHLRVARPPELHPSPGTGEQGRPQAADGVPLPRCSGALAGCGPPPRPASPPALPWLFLRSLGSLPLGVGSLWLRSLTVQTECFPFPIFCALRTHLELGTEAE